MWFIWYYTMTNIFKLSSYTIGILWVQLYWLEFSISAFALLFFLSLIDTWLWFYIAHKKGLVSSRIWSDWLFKKCIWLFLVSGGIFFMWNMWYVVDNNTLTAWLSILTMIMIAYRIIFELISLVENMAIISSTEEQKTLKRIVVILLKIVWIGQSQIEKKIERYTT
jgi:hypothetical protein